MLLKNSRIAMIGECMIELNGKPFDTLYQNFGGDTLNAAIYSARAAKSLNIPLTVSYITALGTDPISQQMQAIWQAENIDTDLICEFAHKSPGLYWIILDEQGERSFMFWRDQSAAKMWLQHEKAGDILNAISHYDWICLSGISLAILSIEDRQKLFSFLKKYHENGGKIAFDSNYRSALWPNQAEMHDAYSEILKMTHLALLTNEDEMAIWNIQEDEILDNLSQFNLPILVLKCGENGAQIIENNDINTLRTVNGFKVDSVVDTTSAGDSFNAGVITSLIKGLSIDAACINGHKIASTVIQHKGAIIPMSAMPDL